MLLLATQAAAAAKGEATANADTPRQAQTKERQAVSLQVRLDRKLDAADKYRSVIRFFDNHRTLLASTQHRSIAQTALRRATRRLARVSKTIAVIRRVLARREARKWAQAPPKVAICKVFGRRYCGEALSVSWCESRLRTTAQNGQYLGLFQMGSYERELFGHGANAHSQALAAHRYFVVSGRDWSPWSCKPGYG